MLISPQYVRDNVALHNRHTSYGSFGSRWAGQVRSIHERYGCADILDYGCGKGTLAKALPDFIIHDYDPAVPGKDALPVPADLVVCTDVLEHIEPHCLGDVLTHIASLARKVTFLNISTRPAAKLLEDGRNAHLIIKEPSWWQEELIRSFEIDSWKVESHAVTCVARPKS